MWQKTQSSSKGLAAVPCQRLCYPPLWQRHRGCQSWWWILSVLQTGRTRTSRERNDQVTMVPYSFSSSSSSFCSLLCIWGLQLGEMSPVQKSAISHYNCISKCSIYWKKAVFKMTTLLCFSSARAFTASNRWASLGEASVNTKISESGGLCVSASWKHTATWDISYHTLSHSCKHLILLPQVIQKETASKFTWMAERHISGSSPPPSAIRFSMNSINWFGSLVSCTGPKSARKVDECWPSHWPFKSFGDFEELDKKMDTTRVLEVDV